MTKEFVERLGVNRAELEVVGSEARAAVEGSSATFRQVQRLLERAIEGQLAALSLTSDLERSDVDDSIYYAARRLEDEWGALLKRIEARLKELHTKEGGEFTPWDLEIAKSILGMSLVSAAISTIGLTIYNGHWINSYVNFAVLVALIFLAAIVIACSLYLSMKVFYDESSATNRIVTVGALLLGNPALTFSVTRQLFIAFQERVF